MKRVILSNKVVKLLPIFFYANMALADNYIYTMINGLTYKLHEQTKTASVSSSGNQIVRIPETITYNDQKYIVNTIEYIINASSVYIPKTIVRFSYHDFVAPSYCFRNCSDLDVHISDLSSWLKCEKSSSVSDHPFECGYKLYLNGSIVHRIVIPDDVTYVGASAFDACDNALTIIIPDHVKSIRFNAFQALEGPVSIVIGNGIKEIPAYTFGDNIQSLTIGNGVTSISEKAFMVKYRSGEYTHSKPQKTIWLTNTPPNGYENAMGRINYVSNNQYNKWGADTYIYPFLSSMFEVNGIKYVPVSPSERTCDAIDCLYDYSYEKVQIGPYVTNKGVSLLVREINPYTCYKSPITLLEVNMEGCIGKYAFSDCDRLNSIILKEGIDTIDNYAFESCSAIQSVEIPNSVKKLGNGAFSWCSQLGRVKVGNGLTSIEDYTFAGTALRSVTIPQNITSILDNVFVSCKNLRYVILNDGDSDLYIGHNYSSPLFCDCPLDSVYVGRNIYYSTLSNNGYSPFYCNKSLRSVRMTNKETEISDNEFYGCANLKNVRIGNKITKIGDWAFSGCSSLDYFAFAGKVKSIGKEAFSDCTNIKKIVSLATTPPVCGTQALDDINKWNCTLMVPTGALSAYQAADQWKEFFSIQEGATRKDVDNDMDVTLSSLGYATFYDPETNYTLPQGLTAYTVTGTQNDKIVYEEVARGADRGVVPRGIAVMLKSDKMQAGTFTLVQTDVTKSYTGENLLHGSDETTMTSADGDSYFYKLAFGAKGSELENVFGWYWGADNGAAFRMDAHKAWLAIPKEQAHKIRAFNIEGDATAIADHEEETSGAETDNAIYYDLQGRRITHPNRRGIYIRNGKKVAFAK